MWICDGEETQVTFRWRTHTLTLCRSLHLAFRPEHDLGIAFEQDGAAALDSSSYIPPVKQQAHTGTGGVFDTAVCITIR